MKKKNIAIGFAILAAALYAINIPVAKLLTPHVSATMLLGFVAYGLSINFYILAQKDLGAAKTSAYYSIAPFLGVAFSMLLLGGTSCPAVLHCAGHHPLCHRSHGVGQRGAAAHPHP